MEERRDTFARNCVPISIVHTCSRCFHSLPIVAVLESNSTGGGGGGEKRECSGESKLVRNFQAKIKADMKRKQQVANLENCPKLVDSTS